MSRTAKASDRATSEPADAVGKAGSTPVVNEGFMYVHNGWGQVLKIDVRSGTRGQTLWIHDPELESGGTMRGSVALLGNDLYYNTRESNPRLIKVNTDTGETVWEIGTAAPEDQAAATEPMAVNDRILVANRGTRGSLAAYSQDGELSWRFWTVPGPGEFGHETWADDWGA